MAEFNAGIAVFLSIALLTVFFGILKNFFVSHYVFRWRTAMNEHYMAYWQKLRHIDFTLYIAVSSIEHRL